MHQEAGPGLRSPRRLQETDENSKMSQKQKAHPQNRKHRQQEAMKTELEACKQEFPMTESVVRTRVLHSCCCLQLPLCFACKTHRVHHRPVIRFASWCWSVDHVRDNGPFHFARALQSHHRLWFDWCPLKRIMTLLCNMYSIEMLSEGVQSFEPPLAISMRASAELPQNFKDI